MNQKSVFCLLRDADSERCSVAQLLQTFYGRHQLEGEDFFEYSHALSQILRSALKQNPNAVTDGKMAVRDQFVEGVRDSTLRRELRKMVREKPDSTLFHVREEAVAWSLEDKPHGTRLAKSRNILCDSAGEGGQRTGDTRDKSSATLDEILKVVSEQGKAIGELVNAVRESVTVREKPYRGGRPRPKFEFTEDGKPVCFKCKVAGHIARECRSFKEESHSAAGSAFHQGN